MLVVRMVRMVRIWYTSGTHDMRLVRMVRLWYAYVLSIHICVTFLNIISITDFIENKFI